MWKWINSWFGQANEDYIPIKNDHPRLFADRENEFYDEGKQADEEEYPKGYDPHNYVELVENPHNLAHVDVWWDYNGPFNKVKPSEDEFKKMLLKSWAQRISLKKEGKMIIVSVDNEPVLKVQL